MSIQYFLKFRVILTMALVAALLLAGCTTMKRWVGMEKGDEEEEELIPPEAQQETVMVDGKPYVRSRNPYYLTYAGEPEYIYVEKGKEFKGVQTQFMEYLARAIGKERDKAGRGAVPPDKLHEMVRQEVDRILREQGLGGFVSRAQAGDKAPYYGRAVAVIPNPETPASYAGLSRTLAVSLGEALARQKDMKVVAQDQVKSALGKAGIHGKLALRPNIQALGDALGVQAVILTGIVPPAQGSTGFLALEVYDAFLGTKAESILGPAGKEGLGPDAVNKFVRDNSIRVGSVLLNQDWFGRVEFIKEGNVYLNLGQNAGLKVGDRLKVVEPGKEVVNPQTHASLGFTADIPKGDLKVTELLSNTGAVAQVISGGPFKTGDKVKAR